jgi:pyruvate-ferredoxin/flavodoxin oxidoreductase
MPVMSPAATSAAPTAAAAPATPATGPIWLDTADEALCNDCGTCYQELPQFFAKTTVVIDGEARVIARMIPGAAQTVEVTPDIAKRIDRVRANCDAEIIR